MANVFALSQAKKSYINDFMLLLNNKFAFILVNLTFPTTHSLRIISIFWMIDCQVSHLTLWVLTNIRISIIREIAENNEYIFQKFDEVEKI